MFSDIGEQLQRNSPSAAPVEEQASSHRTMTASAVFEKSLYYVTP
jgi:hypothetical protein